MTRKQNEIELLFSHEQFQLKDFHENEEGQEYAACSFLLNAHKIQYRHSKITPTKVGQFVTIWKRNTEKVTVPYNGDEVDFIIVCASDENKKGLFIFPKDVLIQKEILSTQQKDGKRGIRVYPPWDAPSNKQAVLSQKWQCQFFHFIEEGEFQDQRQILDFFQ